MKALVKATAGPGLEWQDVPDPEVGPMDVLIRIRSRRGPHHPGRLASRVL